MSSQASTSILRVVGSPNVLPIVVRGYRELPEVLVEEARPALGYKSERMAMGSAGRASLFAAGEQAEGAARFMNPRVFPQRRLV